MSNAPSHWLTRSVGPAIVGGLALNQLVRGIDAGVLALILQGVGLGLMAMLAFLQPVAFNVPLRQVFAASEAMAIGPPKLRLALVPLALAFLLSGMVCNVLRL